MSDNINFPENHDKLTEFNEINKMFSGKLNIINEKFLKGTYNFVLIVELEKETLDLR
jgi:hypothetical protein